MERSTIIVNEVKNALELSCIPEHVQPNLLKLFLENCEAAKGKVGNMNIDRATKKAFVTFTDDEGMEKTYI